MFFCWKHTKWKKTDTNEANEFVFMLDNTKKSQLLPAFYEIWTFRPKLSRDSIYFIDLNFKTKLKLLGKLWLFDSIVSVCFWYKAFKFVRSTKLVEPQQYQRPQICFNVVKHKHKPIRCVCICLFSLCVFNKKTHFKTLYSKILNLASKSHFKAFNY